MDSKALYIHLLSHHQKLLYPSQEHSGFRAYLSNTGCKVWIHPGWDDSPLQGTMYTHIHTRIHTHFRVTNFLSSMFMEGGREKAEPRGNQHRYKKHAKHSPSSESNLELWGSNATHYATLA